MGKLGREGDRDRDRDVSWGSWARTQAGPGSAQGAVPAGAHAAMRPHGVLTDLVVAAGVGALGTLVDVWGHEGDREVAPGAAPWAEDPQLLPNAMGTLQPQTTRQTLPR